MMWMMRLGEFFQRRVSQAGAIVTPIIESRTGRSVTASPHHRQVGDRRQDRTHCFCLRFNIGWCSCEQHPTAPTPAPATQQLALGSSPEGPSGDPAHQGQGGGNVSGLYGRPGPYLGNVAGAEPGVGESVRKRAGPQGPCLGCLREPLSGLLGGITQQEVFARRSRAVWRFLAGVWCECHARPVSRQS